MPKVQVIKNQLIHRLQQANGGNMFLTTGTSLIKVRLQWPQMREDRGGLGSTGLSRDFGKMSDPTGIDMK